MRRTYFPWAIGILLLSATLRPAIATDDGNTGAIANPNSDEAVRAYWTPERMRNARPMPMPSVPPAGSLYLPIPNMRRQMRCSCRMIRIDHSLGSSMGGSPGGLPPGSMAR